MTINEKRKMIRELIESQKGKFFAAKFIGVTGDEHVFNGRVGVYKYSHGGKNYASGKDYLINAFNVQKMAYRNINLDGVTEIHAGREVYTF